MTQTFPKMSRRVFGTTIEQHTDPRADTRFWLSQPPQKRLEALEQLRTQVHGSIPGNQRLHFGTRAEKVSPEVDHEG